jgi:hypothetical protein
MPAAPSHIYHHDDDKPRFSVKVEHNSRGTNWEIGASNCPLESLESTLRIMEGLEKDMTAKYGQQAPVVSVPS